MKAGDRVLYVRERGDTPVSATVVRRLGTSVWVDLLTDDDERVSGVFAATSFFQSPMGNCCVIRNGTTTLQKVGANAIVSRPKILDFSAA